VNQMFIHTEGILDVISQAAYRDTCYVLPTLNHAIEWWRVVRTAAVEIHEEANPGCVAHTETACIFRCNNRVLRYWVPYERDPTKPMDFPHEFKFHCDYMSPWFYPREMKDLVEFRSLS